MPDVGGIGGNAEDDSTSFISPQIESEGRGALMLVAGLAFIALVLVFALGISVGAHLPN